MASMAEMRPDMAAGPMLRTPRPARVSGSKGTGSSAARATDEDTSHRTRNDHTGWGRNPRMPKTPFEREAIGGEAIRAGVRGEPRPGRRPLGLLLLVRRRRALTVPLAVRLGLGIGR